MPTNITGHTNAQHSHMQYDQKSHSITDHTTASHSDTTQHRIPSHTVLPQRHILIPQDQTVQAVSDSTSFSVYFLSGCCSMLLPHGSTPSALDTDAIEVAYYNYLKYHITLLHFTSDDIWEHLENSTNHRKQLRVSLHVQLFRFSVFTFCAQAVFWLSVSQ